MYEDISKLSSLYTSIDLAMHFKIELPVAPEATLKTAFNPFAKKRIPNLSPIAIDTCAIKCTISLYERGHWSSLANI